MKRRTSFGDPRGDPVSTWLAIALFVMLAAGGIGILVLYPTTRLAEGPARGTWVGHDGGGGEVVYRFGADGRGYRVVGSTREGFGYDLIDGRLDALRLRVRLDGDTTTSHGLAYLRRDGSLDLELGASGASPPHRLTGCALHLLPERTDPLLGCRWIVDGRERRDQCRR